MIAFLALVAAAAVPHWQMVGTSASGLRIFVDRASIHDRAPWRDAIVRMGSPRTIVGRIVEVIQHEQFDCRTRRWRLVRFTAFDETGAIVARTKPGATPSPPVAAPARSLSADILATVCGISPPAEVDIRSSSRPDRR